MKGEPAPDDHAVTVECSLWGGAQRMVRSGRWKYILSGDDEVLFDMETDPWEERDLSKDPSHTERCGELKKRALDGWKPPPDGYLQEGVKPVWPK
jgi:arylsulfatase A-like enzyme